MIKKSFTLIITMFFSSHPYNRKNSFPFFIGSLTVSNTNPASKLIFCLIKPVHHHNKLYSLRYINWNKITNWRVISSETNSTTVSNNNRGIIKRRRRLEKDLSLSLLYHGLWYTKKSEIPICISVVIYLIIWLGHQSTEKVFI